MPNYVTVLSNHSRKQLDKLSDYIAAPILDAIGRLEENPRPMGYKKLKGSTSYRIRVGDYRIIYDIFDTILVIEVITLGHRKEYVPINLWALISSHERRSHELHHTPLPPKTAVWICFNRRKEFPNGSYCRQSPIRMPFQV